MVATGFSHIFSSMVEMFYFIYTSGQLLWQWLSTPLEESAAGVDFFLGDFAALTPFELMFGPAITFVLILIIF